MYEDFISLADLTRDDIEELLALAIDLKRRHKAGETYRPLDGKTLGMLFEKPSLRTRVTFETGIYQLGGQGVFMEMRLGERETVPDIARNLERWVDGIVARTHSHESVLELASYASIPVINALTDRLHPCHCSNGAARSKAFMSRLSVTATTCSRHGPISRGGFRSG